MILFKTNLDTYHWKNIRTVIKNAWFSVVRTNEGDEELMYPKKA